MPRKDLRTMVVMCFVLIFHSNVMAQNGRDSVVVLIEVAGINAGRSFEMGGCIDSTRAWQARRRAGTLAGTRILTSGRASTRWWRRDGSIARQA